MEREKGIILAKYRSLTADQTVGFWMAVWWIANLIVSGCSELANDEAYYHIFAQNLAWGYFDHPPVTALLVWLGEHIFSGELGVRFFFTILQPIYLYIFWLIIRPAKSATTEQPTRQDGELYAMITASMLILQLYGLIAVPDGPLMFFTSLFLLTFKHFTESRRWAWLTMGLTLGLLALSKYHGALVLIFALLANVGWFIRNPRKIGELALSGVVALAIITPHLMWQSDHDWVSFAYHLSDRNKAFELGNVIEYIVNILVVFSPFFVPLWVQAMRKVEATTPITRTLKFYPAAFFIFFGISVFRGYVQPQWTIVAAYGLVWLLWSYTRLHTRTRRYVMKVGYATLALLLIVRVVLICNPIGLRAEVFENKSSYSEMAEAANGRPLIVNTRYTTGAKYDFYTGGEVYCQSSINHRTSEWEFLNNDDNFINREVIIEVDPANYTEQELSERVKSIKLSNGRTFSYVEEPKFQPVRKVRIEAEDFTLPEQMKAGDKIVAKLRIFNPYPYDILLDGEVNSLTIAWRWATPRCSYFPLAKGITLPAGKQTTIDIEFTLPDKQTLPEQHYKMGFAIRHRDIPTWYNSEIYKTEITK